MHLKHKTISALSVLLILVLTLAPVAYPLGYALASEADINSTEEVSDATTTDSAPTTEQSDPVAPETSVEGKSDSTGVENNVPGDSDEASEEELSAGSESNSANPMPLVLETAELDASIVASSEALSFLYIDVAEIEPGETQNVVIALNESIGSVITSAALTIQNEAGVDVATYELANSDALAALFSFDTSELGVGTYQIGSMNVVTDAGSYVIDFSDAQVRSFSVSYGVSSLSFEEEGHDSVTAYTIDEEGNLVEAESVALAVSSAQQVTSSRSRSRTSSLVIALDPGHGGYDSGAVGVNGVHEADLTWKIANYCRDELVNEYGAKVVLTRGQNENPSLKERAQRAADAGAGVLVSIHLNSSGSGAAYGSEIYVPNNYGYDTETHSVGVDLAEKIIDQLAALGLHNRGVKTRDYNTGNIYDANADGSNSKDYYGIIRESRALGIPGIIVEHAFIDNVSDYNNYLSSDAKLKALGVADATGIAQQFGLSKSLEERYAAVYDFDYYVSRYDDIKTLYSNDRKGAFEHFLNYGMSEGRRGSAGFEAQSYYNRYPDLREAYGTDLRSYYLHFIKYGEADRRTATGCPSLQGWVTSAGGVDYSAVYDPEYYYQLYPDMRSTYTKIVGEATLVDDVSLLGHFLDYGMSEGRRGSAGFEAQSYYNRYPDLREAYGTDLRSYYLHFIKYGEADRRTATGCPSLQGWVTSAGGVDYSAVYDPEYYYQLYPDMRSTYTKIVGEATLVDDVSLLGHFLDYGMSEGRRGSAGFNVKFYQYRYPDLQLAYGTNLKSYYLHYVRYGFSEGREADGEIPPNWSLNTSSKNIMGTSTTTAAQMARYYRAVAGASTYPSSVYSSKGAPTIEDFARVVYEEAAAEGVRAEVVFCQAMHETGWLRFGGDVSVGQCNFAGIGATGGGVAGATFADVRTGIRAQVQHLKAYASTEPLNNSCVDPRFHYVTRGIAPTLDDLDGRWAAGNGYGGKIYSLMQELAKH